MATKPRQIEDKSYAERLAQTNDVLHQRFDRLLKSKKLYSPFFQRAIDEAPSSNTHQKESLFDEMFEK